MVCRAPSNSVSLQIHESAFNHEDQFTKRTCWVQAELLATRKHYPGRLQSPCTAALSCSPNTVRKEKNHAPLSAAVAVGLSSSCYQAWAVTYSTGSFPRVSTTGNFLGGSSWYRAPHPRTDTCKLAEAEWAEEVGVNRRRRQGYEGWAAEREMEGNNEAFCFLWPWIRQKVAYSPAHVSFHLWASGFSPGQDN